MNIIHKKNLIYANKSLTGLLGLDKVSLCVGSFIIASGLSAVS